ncbi:MAG: HAMP domain-containing sensor histidine kinase [Acidobacteriota bacterium]|nr:HAMP domain-containing sensor histidine kinase [Acidobacteriota bacterium]
MKRNSLQTQLGIRIVMVAVAALAVMVVMLSFLTHGHMHRQTDALLLHLAHAEATNILDENKDIHVHGMSIPLPSFTGGLRERYAMAFDMQGNILDHTDNLKVGDRIPQSWLSFLGGGDPYFFNTGDLPGPLLRMVVIPLKFREQDAYISVGVAHADLDASLWSFVSIAVPVALLAAGMIGFAGVWSTRRRIKDLTRLGDACRQLELFSGKISGDRDRQSLTLPEKAAEEFHVLASTLRELINRVEGLLETQNRFVAEAAHELRTPLTSLRGDLELALRRERKPEEYREFIQEALTDVDRLKSLAFDLLEGARGRAGHLELTGIPLRVLIDEAMERRSKSLIQAGLDVSILVPDHLRVSANRSGTIRILENLLDNAVRHSGATKLRFLAEQLSEKVCLLISDDGVGIAPDLAERLFHPFQRGNQRGFGLGLYIAHQLMRAQEGDITVTNGTGELKGACWELTFSV